MRRGGESGVDAGLTPDASAAARAFNEPGPFMALVNSGSKLETSSSPLSFGLKGGTTFFLVKAAQSISAKKG